MDKMRKGIAHAQQDVDSAVEEEEAGFLSLEGKLLS